MKRFKGWQYPCLLLFIYFSSAAAEMTIIPDVIVKKPLPRKGTDITERPRDLLLSGALTTITRAEMNAVGTTSLAEVLQNLAGVQLQDSTGNGSQVALGMRGFGGNAASNTLLLINGIPITNPDLAPPNLNSIALQNLAAVEVLAGSESVLYGDQAVAGIINLVTRMQSLHPVTLDCSLGSEQLRQCYLNFFYRYQDLQTQISINQQQTHNYRDHNNYSQSQLQGDFELTNKPSIVHLNYQLGHESMQYPGALTAIQVRQNRQQASNDRDFFKNWNGMIHLSYTQAWDHGLWQNDLMARGMKGEGVLYTAFAQTRTLYTLRSQWKTRFNHIHLITGVDAEADQYHLHSDYGTNADRQQKYGVFTLWRWPVRGMSITAGLRTAQQRNHLFSQEIKEAHLNGAWASTLGFSALLPYDTEVYLKRAESFRFPKADEDASTPPGTDGLKTQRGTSYETGIKWGKDRQAFEVNLYQLNLRDEITFDPLQTPTNPFGTNKNLPPTERRGYSISGHGNLTSALRIDGQYRYVNARFQNGINKGKRIPLVAEQILRMGLNYHLREDWQLYFEGIYTGNQFAANDNANLAGPIGGYTIFNVNVRYQRRQFIAVFHLRNAFNRFYYYYSVFQTYSQTEFFYPAPGRNVIFTFKYLLG